MNRFPWQYGGHWVAGAILLTGHWRLALEFHKGLPSGTYLSPACGWDGLAEPGKPAFRRRLKATFGGTRLDLDPGINPFSGLSGRPTSLTPAQELLPLLFAGDTLITLSP
jgi:hypothetical protein